MMTAVIYIITLLCGRPGVEGTILSACSTNKPGIDSEDSSPAACNQQPRAHDKQGWKEGGT